MEFEQANVKSLNEWVKILEIEISLLKKARRINCLADETLLTEDWLSRCGRRRC
ncbi:hypothetical protein HY450_00735 [Candidatus Pacearchaeota archaeon]|nr:hypothetical protein [Candidatus Pacearchaeota archaeon]